MAGYRCCSFWPNCLHSGGLNVTEISSVSSFVFANEELTFKMSVTSLSKRVFLTLIILSLDLPSLTLSYCFTNIHDDPQCVLSKRI